MNQEIFNDQQPANSTIHPEAFIQIIKAILLGKYCWACILFLYCLGYNPTEYIPYQTYVQVMKDNHLPGIKTFKKLECRNFRLTNIKSEFSS